MEDSKVLDVQLRVFNLNTAWSVEASLNQSTIWIEVIDDWIRILLLRCSEYNNLEVLICSLKALTRIWSDIDASENWLRLFRELDWNHDIRVIRVYIIHTVNQSLI